ncbi:related to PRY1 - strong similarity to the plant PR-1 class of pathogen related proteins [Melanopsichium pennsylvanicum]|uniref:Related to PRY1 - strong similarity to the plant PR-1 class of pathogen related proteins n=2 Tax=Melanopsichium pennsylvanicum TaxID=63383 RepID=A0AAJ4XI78_9BASI|nr:related to PRY1-strong similarity to the plant PR-1 class of pathogen related proteins [Melanopsichium pennsylvanicum 4]SNX82593.1 related to PRY1 - strong similarity to the plant PR-1 class of pathogen related proteins [Melanopsichium pennsylvanicum]
MRFSSPLITVMVGALVVLTPTFAVPDSNNDLVVADAEMKPRGTSSSGYDAEPHCRRHHHKHKKGKKSKAKAKAQAKMNKLNDTQSRISSARHSLYYHKTQQQQATKSSSTTSKASTATKSTPTTSKASTSSTTGSTSSTSSAGSSTSNLSSFEQTILSIHNADRAKHSAAALTWSSTLTSAAAQWASGCKWAHTPNNPYGQNIAAGTSSTFGAADSANMWYDEVKLYNFSSGTYSDATGHFTQMVWKATKQVGCAIQECTAQQMGLASSGTSRFVVCNYDPPGNVIGSFLQNVLSS